MGSHALLSASSSHRWISCPPSARLCENCDDQSSEYAKQGTDAHSLCQYKVESALEMDTADPTDSLNFYDEEMENCAESYAAYVMEQRAKALESCIDPVVLVEQRLDFSKYVPEGFGTGDCVIIADGTLSVIDYKHGKGILVESEKNPQMLCYALGALELFDGIYDIDIVSMTIFQPRRENVSTYTVTKAELLKWAEEILIPRAKLAYAGEGAFMAGEHCQFCKVKATCRKRAEYNLELARYDFEMPAALEDEEIEAILAKADDLAAWVSDIKEFALQSKILKMKIKEDNLMSNVKNTNPMKVITSPNTRWSYANVWESKSINGGAPKYSVSLIIPKSDSKTVAKIQAAIEAAYKEGESKLKGNGRSVTALSALKTPLRDGDTERPDDEAYADSYFINANSASAPGIVDADRQPIIDRSEVYSGAYGRASINFYAFNSSGNKGIACGLNNLQKIQDGEPLGGKSRAEDDFANEEEDDFLA